MRAEFFRSVAVLDWGEAPAAERTDARRTLAAIAADADHQMRDQAVLALATDSYRNGSYDEAIATVDELADSTSSRRVLAEAEFVRASALEALDHSSRAADAYEESIQLALAADSTHMPQRARLIQEARKRRGVQLFWADRYDDAITALERYAGEYPSDAETPQIIRFVGEAAYAAGRYDYAVTTLERLVDAYPGSDVIDDALYTIGWSHFRKNDLVSAESAFGRLVKAYPMSEYAAESQLRRADCHYLQQDFDRAAELYAAVGAMSPDEPERLYSEYQRGMATWQKGDTMSARRLFALYVANHEQSPWSDDAIFMTGLLDYRSGDYRSSIRVMRRLLDSYADSRLQARAYYTIGDSYYRMRQFDEALAAYSIVTERFPTSSYAPDAETGIVYTTAAREKINDNENLGAVRVADVTGRPGYELELRRAQIFLDANRVDDAVREFTSFIETYPESSNLPVGWLGLAECALLRTDTTSAIDTLSSLLERFHDGHALPPAALRLSDLYLATADTAEAIHTLQKIRHDYPQSAAVATARLREVELRLSMGDRLRAISLLRQGVMDLDTISGWRTRTGGRMLTLLADLELADGQDSLARMHFLQLRQRDDSLGKKALIALGGIAMRSGSYETAVRDLEDALKQFDHSGDDRSRIELDLASAYEKTGRIDRARELYRAIIERHGDDKLGAEAARRLETLKEL
jgi:TolA-binding protein